MSNKMKNQRKSERVRRGRRLAKQLAAYSMAASAGVFAVDRANAAVIHMDPADVTLTNANNNLFIDIDGGTISPAANPGSDEFNFQYFNFVGSKQTARIVGQSANDRVRIRYYGIKRVPKYPAGKMVDATHPLEQVGWYGSAGMSINPPFSDVWGSATFGYLSYYRYDTFQLAGSGNLLGTAGGVINDDGATRWHAGLTTHASLGAGYIPLQFDIAGQVHYGWMQVEVWGQNDGFANPDGASVTIYDWAYESLANTTILTGDIGSVEAAVPEPATLGMLALGAAGLGALAWRRRKRMEAQ